MAKFLLIHTMPTAVPVAQTEPVAKVSKAISTNDAYWVGAWVQQDDKGNVSRIICLWNAKDVESVNKAIEQLLKQFPGFPVDGPHPMTEVDCESYR